MFKQKTLLVAMMFSSVALTACNSNDDDNIGLPSATTTITVTPSLGKILNGRVTLKNAKTKATIAPTQTLTPSSNGTATFTVPVSQLSEPVLAEVLPTTAGVLEYADEALNKAAKITVPSADINKPVLRTAATVTPNANIGVTALTESAVQQAEKQVGGLIAQNINTANAAVKNALNLNFDITQAPVVVGVGEFSKLIDAALDAQRRAYATYLATLAKEAQRINSASATPALDMAKAFANDYSHDGVFNAVGSQALAINYSMNFLNAWMQWVQNFYSQFLKLNNLEALNQWYAGFNITQPNNGGNGGTGTAVPLRTVDGVEEYACSAEGQVKSASGAGINMDFVNQRGSNINIYWLDGVGARRPYRNNLATEQTHSQGTFVTHPWLITDSTGACIGIYKPVTASKKTITFKNNEVMIGTGTTQTTCSTGVETKFTPSAVGAPYTNGQTVCFNATTTSLAFNNKTLTNPVRNANVNAPYSAYAFKDGDYSYEVIFNNTALHEINLLLTSFIGQFAPVVTTPTVATCASKKLPTAMLSSITDYNGDYKEQGDIVFNLNTSTAKASVKGTEANISEVCGPTNISSGTNHVLITDKGNVTLFKTTAGVYSAEGQEFVDKNKNFFGQKDIPNNCSSDTGNDKLGFNNAPTNFCSFAYTYGASTNAVTNQYYFQDTNNPAANIKVTVTGNAVTSFQMEDNTYAYACGVGSFPACSGISINSNNSAQIVFELTQLQPTPVNTSTPQGLIINGFLRHQKQTTTSINFSACGIVQGTSGMNCGTQVIADFSMNIRNAFNNSACTVSKKGDMLILESGTLGVSAKLNGEGGDQASSEGVIAKDDLGSNQFNTVELFYTNGVLTTVSARSPIVPLLSCTSIN